MPIKQIEYLSKKSIIQVPIYRGIWDRQDNRQVARPGNKGNKPDIVDFVIRSAKAVKHEALLRRRHMVHGQGHGAFRRTERPAKSGLVQLIFKRDHAGHECFFPQWDKIHHSAAQELDDC